VCEAEGIAPGSQGGLGRRAYLLRNGALLLGRLLLGYTRRLRRLRGGLGSGSLLGGLGLGGALDRWRSVNNGENARLGVAGLRACSFARHLGCVELIVCADALAYGTLERAFWRSWTRLAMRWARELRNATAVARAMRQHRSQHSELDLHWGDKDGTYFARQEGVRECSMR
jgi:hypothetical protein